MNITFMRHGLTDLEGKGLIATRMDFPLNELGKEQCKEVAFERPVFTAVYSSPCKRSIETARIVYPHKEPIVSSNISQRDFGRLSERCESEYDPEYLRLVRRFIMYPSDSESLGEIIARISTFLNFLKRHHKFQDKILVISHDEIMQIIKDYFYLEKLKQENNSLDAFTFQLRKKSF